MTGIPLSSPDIFLKENTLILMAGTVQDGHPEAIFPNSDSQRSEFLLHRASSRALPAYEDDPLPADSARDDRAAVPIHLARKIFEDIGGLEAPATISIAQADHSLSRFLRAMRRLAITRPKEAAPLISLAQKLLAILREGRHCGATHLICLASS